MNQGWMCPRCHKINAPWVMQCPWPCEQKEMNDLIITFDPNELFKALYDRHNSDDDPALMKKRRF